LGGSSECVRRGDTWNNCNWTTEGGGGAVLPAAKWTPFALEFTARAHGPLACSHSAIAANLTITLPTNPQRHTQTATMGVPFEALLPYALITGVRGRSDLADGALLTASAVLRIQCRVGRQAQGDAERRQERQTRRGPVGQGMLRSFRCARRSVNSYAAKYDTSAMTSCTY
jgi:hypothetical protein